MKKSTKRSKKQTPKTRKKAVKASPPSAVKPAKVLPQTLPGAVRKKLEDARPAFLHIGMGDAYTGKTLHPFFKGKDWQPITMDMYAKSKPEMVGSLTDLSAFPDSSLEGIWAPHCFERLYPHEVPIALKECLRALKKEGRLLTAIPDMEEIFYHIMRKGMSVPVYKTNDTSVFPVDSIYGLRYGIMKGHPELAHKTGFTAMTLGRAFKDAGFLGVKIKRDGHVLWATGQKDIEPTETSGKIMIHGDDVNDMMRARDELDQPPAQWSGYERRKTIAP